MPTLLVLAASPIDQDRLRLSAEVKEIKYALQRSRNREHWKIESIEAATVDDLRRALLDFKPAVVHFAGHGGGDAGLCFEDADGNTHLADGAPLSKLLHHFKGDLKCIVLNACFSQVQADVIRQEIDYVVGMRTEIGDNTASIFAVAFYDAVFAGTDFRTAFDLGCTTLDLNKLPDTDVPVFLTAPHLDNRQLAYHAQIPEEIERVLHAYLNTPYLDRARYTTAGEGLVPQLRRHYGDQVLRKIDRVRVLGMRQLSGDCWEVEVTMTAAGAKRESTYYIRIQDRNVLIEWEASVGFWSLPVKTFLAMGSSDHVIARVTAELTDRYYSWFSDKQVIYQSVLLKTIDNVVLYGYIKRHTAAYDRLISFLSDGREHCVTLAIAHVRDCTDECLICEFLSETWIYHPNVPGREQLWEG